MKRLLPRLVVLVTPVVCATCSFATMTTIAIDGTAAGAVLAWEGGEPQASVVSGSPASDGSVPKQPGGVTYAPLVVKCQFPPSQEIVKWLGDLCTNSTSQRKILLTDYDDAGNPAGATEFQGARLARVVFPKLDAAAASAGPMTLVFAVVGSAAATPMPAGTSARGTAGGGFRFMVDGLDGTGALRMGEFSISQGTIVTDPSNSRITSATNGPLNVSNLVATISGAKSQTWQAWATDFLVSGHNDDASEKGGSLEFLDATMKSTVLTLGFQHLGIVRFGRASDPAGAMQGELYVEKVSVMTGGGTSQTQTAATDFVPVDPNQLRSGTGMLSDGSKTTDVVPVDASQLGTGTGMLSDGSATSNPTTDTVNGARAILSDSVATSTATAPRAGTLAGATSPATTTPTNPADQGSRDPQGFPRVDGLIRVSFSGQYQPTYTSEEAHYTTPTKIYDLVKKIDDAAKAGGWTQTQFSEGVSGNGKWVDEQWKKDDSSVTLEIIQPEDGDSKYWVRVGIQIPATN